MAGSATSRLQWLDALRAVGAVAVVAQHSFQETALDSVLSMSRVFDVGQYGVFVFFVVSGIIIPRSVRPSKRSAQGRPDLRRFWIRRFFRLWPAYWLSVSVAGVFYATGRLPAIPAFNGDPFQTFGLNLTMFQRALGTPNVLTVYWTLWFELIFYIAVSVVAAVGLARRLPELAALALASAGLLGGVALVVDVSLPAGLVNLAAFAVGAAASELVMPSGLDTRLPRIGVALGVVVLPLLSIAALGQSMETPLPGSINGPAMAFTWLAALATVGFGALFGRQRWSVGAAGSGARPLGWLVRVGVASYSLYLFHLFVVFLSPDFGPFPTFFLDLSISLVLAEFLYRLVEAPAIQAGSAYAGSQWRKSLST